MQVLMQRSMVHAAPRAPLRLPSRPAVRTVVVRASADGLEQWQVNKLQLAFAAGRRQVKVEKLCKELGLPRQTVLQWLKDQPPLDRTQQSLLEARAAAEQAARERQAVLQQTRRAAAAPAGNDGSSPAAAPTPAGRSGSSGAGGSGSGQPAWKQYAKKKPLGRQAEATLEMVFARTQWPSDDTVASLWELHRLPRDKVVEWFQQRRRREQQQQRGGGGGGSYSGGGGDGGYSSRGSNDRRGGSGGSNDRRGGSGGRRGSGGRSSSSGGGGLTDWDAEWQQE